MFDLASQNFITNNVSIIRFFIIYHHGLSIVQFQLLPN